MKICWHNYIPLKTFKYMHCWFWGDEEPTINWKPAIIVFKCRKCGKLKTKFFLSEKNVPSGVWVEYENWVAKNIL